MKKKAWIPLLLILLLVVGAAAWFWGYHHRKSTDNLPALDTALQMDEGDLNALLSGYQLDQLKTVWGEPDESKSSGQNNTWRLPDGRGVLVSSKADGTVVICAILAPGETA